MNKDHRQQALQNIVDTCVHCNQPGSWLDVQEVERQPDAELLHVRCRNCQGALLVLLFTAGPLVNSVGVITDLSREDVNRLQHASALNEDSLLQLHQLLEHENVSELLLKGF